MGQALAGTGSAGDQTAELNKAKAEVAGADIPWGVNPRNNSYRDGLMVADAGDASDIVSDAPSPGVKIEVVGAGLKPVSELPDGTAIYQRDGESGLVIPNLPAGADVPEMPGYSVLSVSDDQSRRWVEYAPAQPSYSGSYMRSDGSAPPIIGEFIPSDTPTLKASPPNFFTDWLPGRMIDGLIGGPLTRIFGGTNNINPLTGIMENPYRPKVDKFMDFVNLAGPTVLGGIKALGATSAALRGAGVKGIGSGNVIKSAATTRIDYSHGFERDLVNFKPGHQLINGPLDDDLVLVSYHADVPIGQHRSAKWWTTTEQANGMSTIDDVTQALALTPEMGKREAVTVIRIPKGTDITAYKGLSSPQLSKTGQLFAGDGIQYRFKDFDPSWIVDTRSLGK